MAIARGAGTEIIRSTLLEDVADSHAILIFGVAHHVYTVLSITAYCQTLAADRNFIACYILGYDAKGSDTGSNIYIFQQDMSLTQTFVWSDKFSFNGNEPSDFSAGAGVDSIAKQDAIADQAQGTQQELRIVAEGSDTYDVTCTFIDQNNA